MSQLLAPRFCTREVKVRGQVIKFSGIPIGSELAERIDVLSATFRELDGFIDDGLSEDVSKRHARIVIVAFERVTEAIDSAPIEPTQTIALVKNALEVATAIMVRFSEAHDKLKSQKFHDDLAAIANSFFFNGKGRRVTRDFVNQIKFFEWARCKGLVLDTSSGRDRPDEFSQEELAEYYAREESDVVRRLLRCEEKYACADGRILMKLSDPLALTEKQDLWAAFKLVPGEMKSIE
ncbi:hypothetical protein SAMN05446635_0233 [Burkholderia sp. OK233]|nr:hypothetical protein SAMN05446635_0233 [Burkholderia sp. OK233]